MLNHVTQLLLPGLLFGIALSSAVGQGPSARANDLPKWVKEVGARLAPKTRGFFTVAAVADGLTNSTKAIQSAIDDCAKAGGGVVVFKPGEYVTGALFLKSNVHVRIDSNVTLLGSQDDAD